MQFPFPSEIISELHEKACNYLLIISLVPRLSSGGGPEESQSIICLIKCLLIFQVSYMRK